MKPIAWIDKNTGKPRMEGFIQTDHDIPLYTHPVKELTNEVYFCSRCGKRLGDGIHTCTPPADILRKAQDK